MPIVRSSGCGEARVDADVMALRSKGTRVGVEGGSCTDSGDRVSGGWGDGVRGGGERGQCGLRYVAKVGRVKKINQVM